LGKLIVIDVFVNIDLLKLLAYHYDLDQKAICNPQGKTLFHVSKNVICEVFDLNDTYNTPIVHEALEKDYFKLDTTYKGWRLPLHRPRNEGSLVPFEEGDEPPFHVELFEPYLRYTYYSVGQVLGIEFLEFMSIVPMVISTDI